MYILNLKTKAVQECSNKDIVKICKKHPDEYEVSEKKEELKQLNSGNEADISEMKAGELKRLAKENGIEDADSMKKEELLEILKDVL